MKKFKMALILSGFNLLFIACTSCQSKHNDESIMIECSAACSNTELFSSIMHTDSLLNSKIQSTDRMENQHPLLSLLRPNIYQDDSGTFFLAISSFIGYAASRDTAAVTDYLKNSPFLPDSISYEWSLINGPVGEYGLIAHRNHEIKKILSNEDIESISVSQEARSTGLKGLIHAGFTKILTIKLNEPGINKIKELLTTDAILLKMNIGKRSIVISQTADELKQGIMITENITDSFIDSLRQMYPTFMKHE
jgi:hypothetical protein